MFKHWKTLFIIAAVLLLFSILFSWFFISVMRIRLEYTQSKLNIIIGELSITKTKLSASELELENNKLQLADKEQQLNTAQNEKAQMLTQYSSLRSKIMARMGLTQRDRQSYITPNDSAVSAKVQEITGGYNGDNNELWSDYHQMYTWIVKNIDYSSDTYTPVLPESISDVFTWKKEFWRTPAETLTDKNGDCEDMALLLISMMESYTKRTYAVWTLSISSKVPKPQGHMAVAFPVKDGTLTILDPAGNCYTGIESGYLRSDSIASAVNSWLSHWSKEMPGAFIDEVMSENVYRQFSSSDEFITWASQH